MIKINLMERSALKKIRKQADKDFEPYKNALDMFKLLCDTKIGHTIPIKTIEGKILYFKRLE